jgi:hypothetical protein
LQITHPVSFGGSSIQFSSTVTQFPFIILYTSPYGNAYLVTPSHILTGSGADVSTHSVN